MSNNQAPQQGNEQRTSILPSMAPSGIGFFGSPYTPADAMLTPKQIGVQVGSSMSDVVNAVKGVAFYTDQIGFGESSNALTRGMPLKPLGVNYFMKTGMTCSNGAEMWHYMEGIPTGNALGARVASAMKDMGLPALKGLAPGMIEDAQNALNPAPIMRSLFGSGYPKCKQVTLPVGDGYKRISDPQTGASWIGEATNVSYQTVNGERNVPVQTRWVQDTDYSGNPISLSRDEWVDAPKLFNKDGTPVKATKKEAFQNMMHHPVSIVTVGILCLIAFGMMKK